MADMSQLNPWALALLAWSLIGLAWAVHLVWRFWRIGFKSPIDLLNDELARDRVRRRRE
jgi:hypothetical protein